MALDPILLTGLEVLRPYLDDIVIAGGWVPYLYAAHLPPSQEVVALKTRDLDLAVQREIPERDKTIDQLLGDADFTCEFRSLGSPPVTVYLATNAGDEVEIEFITTARGADLGVHTVQSGLTAQELRYVELLLGHKWPLGLDGLTAGEIKGRVWVPTPAAFLLQKALSRMKRTDRPKKEKDLYYIFYVIDGFRSWHQWIAEEFETLAATRPSWFRLALQDLEAACETPHSLGIDSLLNQRPGTAYTGLDDDQYRQYAWSVMQMLLQMMRMGLAASGA
ncbi:MAG: GSU2403 family nucleotidyltransferase fold protein [Thermoleophilia bacterium]